MSRTKPVYDDVRHWRYEPPQSDCCGVSLPPFEPTTGHLPPGEHVATWEEVVDRFGWNRRRRQLVDGLAEALALLADAGCTRVWINGGCVTAKEEPGDFDVVWDPTDLDLDRPEEDRTMITNEVQYRDAMAHLAKFEEAIANFEQEPIRAPGDHKRRALELAALRSQAADFEAEIDGYEFLRCGTQTTFEAASLAALAGALVKARIAKGWTHRQLADALGVAEQQIQRYETTEYTSASLARLCDVAGALAGTEIRETVTLSTDAA